MAEETMGDVPEEVPNLDLHPCTICGRTFLPESLKKHAKVCERAQIKKRKIFDSLKQRVEGTDLEQFHQKRYLKRPENPNVTEPKPKPNKWKEKHLELVNTIRAAKGVGDTNNTMSPATKISAPTIGAGNERCPSCDRQFGPKAFDRHVEWCKERKTRIQKSPASVLQAKERLEARIKYRVPPLNKSKRTLTREKYSPTNKTESVTNLRSSSTVFEKNSKSVSSCNLVSPTERKQKTTIGGVIRNKQEHTDLPKVPKEEKKPGPTLTSFKNEYNPFISAEKQLMELLECDDYKPTVKSTKTTQNQRPKTTSVTKPKPLIDKNKKIKSAEKSRQNNKPIPILIDDDLLNDNFELIENLINGTFVNDKRKPDNGFFPKETDNNLNLKTILSERKYSDDMSSIDPSLINENDNLSIPESFKKDYSPTSTVDNYSSDTTIQNEPDVDIYSVQYDKKINSLESFVLPKTETVSDFKRSVSCVDENVQLDKLIKTLHDESFPKKKTVRNLRKTKSQDHSKPIVSLNSSLGRNVKSNEIVEKSSRLKHSDGGDSSDRNQRSYERSRSVSPEKELKKDPENISADELFSIDDDLYEEYKKYEQMYLQEKEEMKKKSAVIGTSDEEDRVTTNSKKISGDSAYGSLNRKTPKLRSRLTKLSPLEHHSQEHQESASSSGSEMSPVMKVSSSSQNQRMSKFCHECGNKYPLSTAKFCVECGVRRLVL